ncbi:MAG: IS200/IS605 family transposase [Oscillatoria sp. PMC 1068.18]|nr:IS200/IS605 family transposase [Oscillatoria sp. PMC 1076.18]MEC4990754.1 IS200/IS605 family transposase [Oscillatoria sp. PMC 1068.18]
MHRNYTQLYLHCVWGTWDRLPLVSLDIREVVYGAIVNQCKQLKGYAIAIGGTEDHFHLLTSFPPTLTISELMNKVKGSSSHLVTHKLKPNEFFKWQGGYGAFTVSKYNIDQVANYIRNQELHHQQKSLVSEWEI